MEVGVPSVRYAHTDETARNNQLEVAMRAQDAVDLINGTSFWPGWRIRAERNYSPLFTNPLIVVFYEFTAADSDRRFAPEYRRMIPMSIPLAIDPREYATWQELRNFIFKNLVEIILHEAREFFKDGPDYHAPYHPHRVDGDLNWASLGIDGLDLQQIMVDSAKAV
jgi:hypothetical protein